MKDAKGHGSDARGAGGAIRGSNGEAMQVRRSGYPGTIVSDMTRSEFMTKHGTTAEQHTQALADQHGVSTQHLNSSGHEWGSPAALADFKREHGGPRDHAAEQRGFNSGAREIARLRRQGK